MISLKTSLAVLSGLTAGLALAPRQDLDLTRLPPPPAEVHAQLATCEVGLSAAVAKAVEATHALARGARLTVEGNVEVELFTADDRREVVVDGKSGEIVRNESAPYVLPGAPVQGEALVSPSGLRWYELVEGTGEGPGPESTVKVHYTGWRLDGKKFDSSVDRGQPATFPLQGVIKGWTEGVGGMKVGGKRKLVIPADLAYGERGVPQAQIPPGAILVFDVELLEIVR